MEVLGCYLHWEAVEVGVVVELLPWYLIVIIKLNFNVSNGTKFLNND